MDLFGAPATYPGFTAADSSPGGRGVPPLRGSGGVVGLDLDLHLRLPYGERLRLASAGAVGEADVAGGRRGAAPARADSAAHASMATRTGWGGARAGTAAGRYRAPRSAAAALRAAGGPPVGGRGGVGGGAGVAACDPYHDDGALGQESQGHAKRCKLTNRPPECLDNLEVMFEHTAADASSCVLGEHISNEGDDGGDESEDRGEESDEDGDDESDNDGDYESDDVVKAINKFMSENARIQSEWNEILRKHLEMKHEMAQLKMKHEMALLKMKHENKMEQLKMKHEMAQLKVNRRHEKIRLVQKLARECGVKETPNDESSDEEMWSLALEDDGGDVVAGMFMWRLNEEMWRLALEDDGSDVVAGMFMFAIHHDKYLNRAEHRKPEVSGEENYEDGDDESDDDEDYESDDVIKAINKFMSENARIQSERSEILRKHFEMEHEILRNFEMEREMAQLKMKHETLRKHFEMEHEILRNFEMKREMAQLKMKHEMTQLKMKHEMAQLKVNRRSEKIWLVQKLARECGVQETNRQLWSAVYKITKDDYSMELFIGTSTPEGRMAFTEQYARVNK
ncbi:unnamed protein product [Urochloa humidicola]